MKEMKNEVEKILAFVPKGKQEKAREVVEEAITRAENRPVEIEVPESEVVKRYNVTDAIEVVKCRKEVLLHCANYWLVVRPGSANNFAGGSLYQALQWYCDSIDGADEAGEEGRKLDESFRSLMVMLLTLPLEIFGDTQYAADLATAVMREKRKYYERLLEKAHERGVTPETEADAEVNAEFMERVQKVGAVVNGLMKLGEDDNEG